MDDPFAPDTTAVAFDLKTDQAPEFWQFLNGLRGDDLLVELIVNELDARSSHTEIRFEPGGLICSGNGAPIDDGGWERLKYIKGAGHAVKAKVGLFGIKNHGLKACFTIGNTIRLRSGGQQTRQTLFANGPDADPYPGAWTHPLPDPDPVDGTRIEVGFRRRAFTIPYGERIEFAAISDEHIATVFQEAIETLPTRLLGIMRPGVLDRYSLTLTHYALGTHRFDFSAGRIKRDGGLISFFRECRETAGDRDEVLVREQACLALSGERSPTKPHFFQARAYRIGKGKMFARDGLVVEIAWAVDAKGKPGPKPGAGRLRYPVTYAGQGDGTLSGTASQYSGPFISDTERHHLAAQSGDANNAVIAACDELLAQALAKILLPKHGAKALALIGGLSGARLIGITNQLLKAHALPAVDRRGRAVRHRRGTMLVVPSYEHSKSGWSPLLARVVPEYLPVLDPKTPTNLVELLASRQCEGSEETHIRFDGKDVVDRMEQVGAQYFPWRSDAEWRRTLGDPVVAREHLDAIEPYLRAFDGTAERPEGAAVHLPDCDGAIHPLHAMKKGAALPTALLELDVPPIIDPALRDHKVLRFDGWKLLPYELRDLLRTTAIEAKPAAVRRRLFGWIADNPDELGRDDWPTVKALPIWPAVDGSLHPFDDLCLPESRIATALGDAIAKPAREVRMLCQRRKTKKPKLVIRTNPSPDEVQAFYSAGTSRYWLGTTLPPELRASFHAFERVVATIGKVKALTPLVRGLREDAVALSQDGVVRKAHSLVRETPEVRQLCLKPKDLLDRPEIELDQLLPPARRAGAAMALDALRDDLANTAALFPRLAIITRSPDPAILDELRALACLPHGDGLVAPDTLAFKGNQGDYWGGWKTIITGQGLSDDAQEIYRAAGVIRSLPNAETSRAYFAWLNKQPASTATEQINCIARHITSRHGVSSWLFVPPEIPCVPVEDGGGVRLLTLTDARRLAVVDDMRELGSAIRGDESNPRLLLAIDSAKGKSEPIGDNLKEWGIPALSTIAKETGSPGGSNIEPAPPPVFETVRSLTGPHASRRFRKQLSEVGVQQSLIEPRFQNRLFDIKRVMVANDLTVPFRVRGRIYRADRKWAVLPGEIWLDRSGELDDTLMEAIADIVFKKPRVPFLGAVLQRALRQRTQDFEPAFRASEQDDYDDETGEGEVGESEQPHPGSAPKPERNNPNPGELYTGGEVKIVTQGPVTKRKQVVTEEIQRKQLKREHYAAHCQMELAVKPIEVLAPTGSYAEHAENRIWMVQAHHPDKTSTHGARHAGNLLILSKVNHDGIGTRFSRSDIADALRERWTPRQILNADGSVWLDGGIACAIDKVTGEVVPFYFTDWHRDYWLEMASD